jgi:uncharacterized protein (TIGR03066 family)
MRTLLLGFAAVLPLACGAFAADDKKDEPKIDGKLVVGKWEPKVPKAGELTLLELTKDGKLLAIAEVGGKPAKAEGTYKLDGNKFTYEVTYMGETTKDTVTLTKLTDEEMEGKDKEGKMYSYKRVKSK